MLKRCMHQDAQQWIMSHVNTPGRFSHLFWCSELLWQIGSWAAEQQAGTERDAAALSLFWAARVDPKFLQALDTYAQRRPQVAWTGKPCFM